jgi:hypothetical protein
LLLNKNTLEDAEKFRVGLQASGVRLRNWAAFLVLFC